MRKRGYVQREFKFALDKWREYLVDDIYIVPIRFDDCEIPEELAEFQWVDLFFKSERNQVGWDPIMQSITEGVRRRHAQGHTHR